MDNQELETRLNLYEARLAFCEQRLASVERLLSGAAKEAAARSRRRELTPEEKKAIRERLVAGQEKARARRKAEAKAEAKREKKEAK